jgi:hypothetical protein
MCRQGGAPGHQDRQQQSEAHPMNMVTVACPACGQQASVLPSAVANATCNAHHWHHHRQGELMHLVNTIDYKQGDNQ